MNSRALTMALLAAWALASSAVWADEAADKFYKERIEPALKKHCFECHSHASGESNGQLMLDSMAGMTGGGTRGPAIVAGKPADSLLMKALGYQITDLQMPPAGKLPDEAIEDFRKWIEGGALGAPAGSGSTSASGIKRLTPEEAASHWAYSRPARAELKSTNEMKKIALGQGIAAPAAQAAIDSFATSRLDSLLLSEQLAAGVLPSAAADRSTLARRLSYDLTGLPADPAITQSFVSDPRPLAVAAEALVDRLISSAHFGERWARYWMDVARYADTKGYVFQEDRNYPQAFRYRDWLVAAFNADKPYTDFIAEQLAGDILDPQNEQGKLPALGFLTLGRRFLNNKNDIIDDRLDVTMRGLMGLTLACARCHDHKYDPVSQADYYALYGVFLNTDEPGGEPWPHRLSESKEDHKSFVLIRGQPGNHGDQVSRRFVSFLAPDNAAIEKGSGRDKIAARITSSDNPLTARVLVNRVWMRIMGASLVESPSDFGARCPAPRQQAVLDDLAVDFMESGWSIKQLVRRIVTSAAYRQSSVSRPEAATKDTENALYWRMNRRRMDFESLRDGVLAVAGQLDQRIGGESEKIHQAPYSHRRTVYAFIDRQNLPGVFRNFDVASPDAHSPQRLPTTVPQQGLYILNSGFVSEMSQFIGSRVTQANQDGPQQVRYLFRRILQREPAADEMAASLEFLKQVSTESGQLPPERWQCGYGELDPATGKLSNFAKLPHRTDGAWQGGAKLPDDRLGWTMLNKDGGHPGHALNHAVVRRWIAPRDGVITVRGKLIHRNDMGDGVRGTVSSNRVGKLGQWSVKQKEERTVASNIDVKVGDVIDMIVDSQGDEGHDSFEWKVRIQYQGGGETFDSSKDLPGIAPIPMAPLDQLAQALLASNEFAFVD